MRCSFCCAHGGPTDDPIRSPGCSKGRFADPTWPRGSPRWLEFDQLLPADHPARRIDRFVDSLDLTALRDAYRGTGSQAHPPDLMLKMALWQVHDGRPSPAQWACAESTDVAMFWLGQGVRPSRSACYSFRRRMGSVGSKPLVLDRGDRQRSWTRLAARMDFDHRDLRRDQSRLLGRRCRAHPRS